MMGDEEDTESSNCERLLGAKWQRLRKEVLQRDGHQCANCGVESELEVHHIVPVGQGGTNEKTNLLTLCSGCHSRAHGRNPERETPKSRSQGDNRWLPTVGEVRELIRAEPHPQKEAILLVLAKTGIGVGELCNLNLGDIYLADSEVADEFHHRTKYWDSFGTPAIRIQVSTSSPYSYRRERNDETIVPIDGELRPVLKRWLAIRPDTIASPPPFFTKMHERWGERLSPAAVGSIVESRASSQGLTEGDDQLKNLTPYTLRFFFAERFDGQPAARDYILGRHSERPFNSFEVFARHYESNIYSLV